MDKEDQEKLIGNFVEKITKGVRKQLKGYVAQTKEEIEWSVKRVEQSIIEFERLIHITKSMRKDWEAVEMMLRESKEQKKLLLEMRQLYCEIGDKFMDINLLEIEIKNYIQGLRK